MPLILDFETDGLIQNESLPIKDQPHAIEIGVLKIDERGNEIDSFSSLLRPMDFKGLPPVITKITGLKDEDLAGAPLFVEIYGALASFFLGERELIAHNARFDLMILVFELRRCGKEFQFPFCSMVTDSLSLWPHSLAKWGQKVKGDKYVQAHRALDDCRLLRECMQSGIVE